MNLKKATLIAFLSLKFGTYDSMALAMEGDVIRPYASVTYSYDDNLRRFNSKERALLATGSSKTSDMMLMAGAGIILDKQVSQQKIYANLNFNRTKFDRNSDLDNDGRELTGRWDWKIGNRLDGKVELFHKEAMVPFSDSRVVSLDPRQLQLNRRTTDRQRFDVHWRIHPRWRLRGALVNSEMEYSAEVRRVANLKEVSEELGFDYLAPSGSVVGVVYRHARGTRPEQFFPIYGGFVSNDYVQNELKLNVDWAVTGKTKLKFLGGVVDRQHDQLSQRDFTGVNMRGRIDWKVTGKTDVKWDIWREHSAQSFVTSSYVLNQGSSLTANWIASAKIAVQGGLQYENRDFTGDPELRVLKNFKDKNVSLSVMYRPTNSLNLTAAFIHSERDGNIDLYAFKSNTVSLTGQYEF